MISRKVYEEALFQTIVKGATTIAPDIKAAFARAIKSESSHEAKEGLRQTEESLRLSEEWKRPACPDTGWPVFYFKVGNECVLEDGFMGLEAAARSAVEKATHGGYLRSTMKHPLTGYDPGTNVGTNIPDFSYQFVPGRAIELTYIAKGGGSECFGGTRHRVVAFADGLQGIQKFIVDAFVAASRAGAICPPSVLGVGIGGTANLAANLAKEAACLRTVGSHHPEPAFRQLEESLYQALNSLKVGAMGAGGDTSVFAVNVEYAYTHIAGIAVDISSNCMVARRATTRIQADGSLEEMDSPDWFGGR
ncbi:MAG: fumarate hydratase [Saccharofermentanales bacterium]